MLGIKAVWFSGSHSRDTIFSLSRSGHGPIGLQPTRQYPFYWEFLRWFVAFAFFSLAACSGEGPEGTASKAPQFEGMPQTEVVKLAGAPLFEGMSDYSYPISSEESYVQRYFDQGMVLAFAFNHAESVRSFRAAQTLDPNCAICFWGEALATGPNINVTSKGKVIMSPQERVAAFAAIQKAISLKQFANVKETALIEAL